MAAGAHGPLTAAALGAWARGGAAGAPCPAGTACCASRGGRGAAGRAASSSALAASASAAALHKQRGKHVHLRPVGLEKRAQPGSVLRTLPAGRESGRAAAAAAGGGAAPASVHPRALALPADLLYRATIASVVRAVRRRQIPNGWQSPANPFRGLFVGLVISLLAAERVAFVRDGGRKRPSSFWQAGGGGSAALRRAPAGCQRASEAMPGWCAEGGSKRDAQESRRG